MEVGKKYYIISHAYWHFVGEVVKIVGPKSVELRNVCQVHSCRRNFTDFFKTGFSNDTQFDVWPNGTTIGVINYAPWEHQIPTKRGV